MSSGSAPYATLNDLPRFEKRGKVTSAPWMKEQVVAHNGRAPNHEPYITCNSQTAPFATFHNQPLPLEYTGPMPDAPWDKDQQHANQFQGSHREYIKSTPYATSDDWQPNKSKVQQAPWDRDELNHTQVLNHQIPHPTPFATEPSNSSSEDPCQTTFT